MVDARRLERVFRFRYQHPGQPARAHRSAALRAQDARRPGVRAHRPGGRAHDGALDAVLRVARLPASPAHRPHRCLCAAVGDQRAAHVRRGVRDHAADHAQDRRPGEGLGSRADLGIHPELRADDRRLHRALRAPDHAARRAARHAGGRVHRVHFDAPGGGDVSHARDRHRVLRHHPGKLVRRRPLFPRHTGGVGRHRRGNDHRVGFQRARAELWRHEHGQGHAVAGDLRLLGAAARREPRVRGLRISRRNPGYGHSLRDLRSGRGDGQRRERRRGRRQLSDDACADRRRYRQPDRVHDGQSRSSTRYISGTRAGRPWADGWVTPQPPASR